ncbi:MAG: class I SAM-dependent methyltransferase [Mycolicibacterium sp.]|nr:class I SAM-dependent methyltransferase [Mycolicibacterium sp.]
MPFVPDSARCVLEVGCAEGTFGAALKQRAGAEVWGIEFNPEVAHRATTSIDRVLIGDVDEQAAALPDGYFDVIVCNDVLEHLQNPGDSLAKLRHKLKPGGVVVASIPNIRYFPALREIIVKKDFPAEDAGIFDRTHLRFFTRKSMVRMFTDAGFTMQRMKGINTRVKPWGLLVTVLSLGYFADGFHMQYACVASPTI